MLLNVTDSEIDLPEAKCDLVKESGMGQACSTVEMRDLYKILVRNAEEKRILGRL
jgi:hypothetical protein